jgi:hypothetical protein
MRKKRKEKKRNIYSTKVLLWGSELVGGRHYISST